MANPTAAMSLAGGDGVPLNAIVLRGGMIVDGTGRPPYDGDVLIQHGRVAATGALVPRAVPRAREVDVRGKIVAPCWIDVTGNLDSTTRWQEWTVSTSTGGSGGVGTFALGSSSSEAARAAVRSWVRDRELKPEQELALAVRAHTRDPARACGMLDRGTLEVNMRADVNVIAIPGLVSLASAPVLRPSQLLRWVRRALRTPQSVITQVRAFTCQGRIVVSVSIGAG